eukprot:TRINITY_DN99617_c0_g1_i1.p1 TRINITY_DN99617_c0_g1~~TRINITY_DN99617_c0_g1_i1.p1  ORF type:complete len:226 (+),score=41.14 TRINITY_DN99617_c0_g1_i1:84-680(+)
MSSDGLVVLVCGSSGSGKSSLAAMLTKELRDAAVIHQDHYFTQPFMPYKDRTDDSYEGPNHIGFGRLVTDVKQKQAMSPLVVVEGHLVATDKELTSLAALAVILRCPEDVCKARRLNRRLRSEQETRELEAYIDKYVWPAYLEHGQPALAALEEECEKSGKLCLVFDSPEVSLVEQAQKVHSSLQMLISAQAADVSVA